MGIANALNTGADIVLGGTLTTGGALTLSGAFPAIFNITGSTNVTFPTSGTLGTVTAIIGTTNEITASASTGSVTLSIPSVFILPGTLTVNNNVTTTGGILSLGADATDGAINVGTGATSGRTITIGNTTAATGITLNSGSGGITMKGVAGVTVSNQAFVTINTATGALGSAVTAGGSGSATTLSITQAAHGFTVGQVIYYTGSAYALAEATTVVLAEALGIVSTVTSSSIFVITMSGYIPGTAGLTGLTAGAVYWLSDATAGLLTTTEPTTVGNVQKPMFIADTTTSGYVINYRGEIIPTAFTLPVSVANGGTGLTSTTSYGLITGGTTSTSALQNAGTGTAGQVYISGGAAALGTWTTAVALVYSGIAVNTALVANNGYYITGGGALVFTMPTTAAAGTIIQVIGNASTSWALTYTTGQSIWVGNVQSTATTGSVTSTNSHDGITLICTTANTTWQSINFQGFLTVV